MPDGWDEQDWRQLVELFRAQPEAGRRDRDRHTVREVTAAAVLARRWGASRAMFLWFLTWVRPVCGAGEGG